MKHFQLNQRDFSEPNVSKLIKTTNNPLLKISLYLEIFFIQQLSLASINTDIKTYSQLVKRTRFSCLELISGAENRHHGMVEDILVQESGDPHSGLSPPRDQLCAQMPSITKSRSWTELGLLPGFPLRQRPPRR